MQSKYQHEIACLRQHRIWSAGAAFRTDSGVLNRGGGKPHEDWNSSFLKQLAGKAATTPLLKPIPRKTATGVFAPDFQEDSDKDFYNNDFYNNDLMSSSKTISD